MAIAPEDDEAHALWFHTAQKLIEVTADWRQVSTEQPWLYAPFAVVGASGGQGATRSRWTSYEVYASGRLVATRPRLSEAKAWAEQVAGRLLDWKTQSIDVPSIMTTLHGETKEFSGPTRWYSGEKFGE